ncbi:hypothetical protein ACOMHN_041422 [Nucella lapillus]
MKSVKTGRKSVKTGRKSVKTGRKSVKEDRKEVSEGKKEVSEGRQEGIRPPATQSHGTSRGSIHRELAGHHEVTISPDCPTLRIVVEVVLSGACCDAA